MSSFKVPCSVWLALSVPQLPHNLKESEGSEFSPKHSRCFSVESGDIFVTFWQTIFSFLLDVLCFKEQRVWLDTALYTRERNKVSSDELYDQNIETCPCKSERANHNCPCLTRDCDSGVLPTNSESHSCALLLHTSKIILQCLWWETKYLIAFNAEFTILRKMFVVFTVYFYMCAVAFKIT